MRPANEITSELIASGLSQSQTALLMELVLSMSTGLSGGHPQDRADKATERRERDKLRKREERKRINELQGGAKANDIAATPSIPSTAVRGLSTGQSGRLPDEEEIERGLQVEGKKKSKKGSRLQNCARASDDDRAFALSTGIPPDKIDTEWAEFVDFWIGVPGARGVKLDWPATWRNRVRSIIWKYKGGHGKSPHSPRTDPVAGRATAREADFVAAMGRGAAGQLEKSGDARREREISGDTDPSAGAGPDERTESRDRPAFRVIG